jgi:hypothetical protein
VLFFSGLKTPTWPVRPSLQFFWKRSRIWFGQSEAMMAILDFASLQQITTLLIALDILFLSYLNSFEVTRLAINLPLGVLKKCCYLLE